MKVTTITVLFIISILNVPGYSQKSWNKEGITFSKKSWGISIVPLISQKTRFTGDIYKYNIGAPPQFGGEVLLNYSYNFEKCFWIVIAAGVDALAYNFD